MSLYRRSPHPDEVEEEMQRDKGYGGQKRKRCMAEDERNRVEAMSSDEGGCLKSSGRSGDGLSTDEGHAFCDRRRGRRVPQMWRGVARSDDDDFEEVDARKGRRRTRHSMDFDIEPEKLSDQERLILKLQEKIEQLEAEKAHPSNSKSRMT